MFGFYVLKDLQRDAIILLLCRSLRLFSFGLMAFTLVQYLVAIGLTPKEIGVILTLTLVGDSVLSLFITATADRFGRRKMLKIGAALKFFSGICFATSSNGIVLTLAATVGVISPSGNEVGPFLAIEQAAITQLLPNDQRTHILAWYNLMGCFASAAGMLVSGGLTKVLMNHLSEVGAYRIVLWLYACLALGLVGLVQLTSSAIEAPESEAAARSTNPLSAFFGLHKSVKIVTKLSCLFAMDAFAGAFVLQSIIAYWYRAVFNADEALIGTTLFICNIVAGISALFAASVAARIGLIMTMVVTHLPSNFLLMLVPVMPNLGLSMTVLILRQCISQMDVPTRQSYVVAVVDPSEKTAAGGVTNIARSVGASLAPIFTGILLANKSTLGVPFFIAGGLKVVYDLLLLWGFRSVKPPEEWSAEELTDAKAASQLTAPLLLAGDEQDDEDEEDGWGFKSSSLPQTYGR